MEKQEGYKRTILGWLPIEWEILPFKDSFHKISSKNYQIKKSECKKSGLLPVIDQGQKYVVGYTDEMNKKIECGDGVIVFGDHTRIIKFVDFDFVVGADGTQLLKNKDNWDVKYQYYCLLNKRIKNLGYSRHFKLVKEMKFVRPSFPEQQKIAKMLTTVDDKISSINERIQQNEQLKKGLIDKLLAEGIGHTEFKDTKIGKVPVGWEVVGLGDISNFINGRGFKPHEWDKSGLPIIRIQNLNGSEEYNYYSGDYAPKILIKNGDLLFAWSGNRGTSFGPYIWEGGNGLLNYHTWKVDYFSESIVRDFLFYQFKRITAKVEQDAHGAAALVHMQKRFIVDYLISLPPIQEQKRIAKILSSVDGKTDVLQHKKSAYKVLKKGLMEQLLTGAIRVKI